MMREKRLVLSEWRLIEQGDTKNVNQLKVLALSLQSNVNLLKKQIIVIA